MDAKLLRSKTAACKQFWDALANAKARIVPVRLTSITSAEKHPTCYSVVSTDDPPPRSPGREAQEVRRKELPQRARVVYINDLFSNLGRGRVSLVSKPACNHIRAEAAEENAKAVSRPMPLVPPITTIVFPSKSGHNKNLGREPKNVSPRARVRFAPHPRILSRLAVIAYYASGNWRSRIAFSTILQLRSTPQ